MTIDIAAAKESIDKHIPILNHGNTPEREKAADDLILLVCQNPELDEYAFQAFEKALPEPRAIEGIKPAIIVATIRNPKAAQPFIEAVRTMRREISFNALAEDDMGQGRNYYAELEKELVDIKLRRQAAVAAEQPDGSPWPYNIGRTVT